MELNIDLPMSGEPQGYFTRTGVPIACPVRLRIPGQPFLLLENARVRVNAQKDLFRTAIAKDVSSRSSQETTAKQFTGADDYYFVISGWLKDHDLEEGKYPVSLISRLNNICSHKREIEIQCPVAEVFGVQYLAITNMTLEPPKGGWVEYSIEGWSDTPWPLGLK